MRTVDPPTTTARHAPWACGVLMVLVGLFGMHGLGTHGTEGIAGQEAMPDAMSSGVHKNVGAALPAADVTSTLASRLTAAALNAAAIGDVLQMPGHGGMDMGAAGMCCIAILGIGLIALLLVRLARNQPGILWVSDRPTRGSPTRLGRDPDPPSLITLSIQRC